MPTIKHCLWLSSGNLDLTTNKGSFMVAAMSVLNEVLKEVPQGELARRLGITSQAITGWVRAGRVPVQRVLAVEAITGVSRHKLRPDVYPEETRAH